MQWGQHYNRVNSGVTVDFIVFQRNIQVSALQQLHCILFKLSQFCLNPTTAKALSNWAASAKHDYCTPVYLICANTYSGGRANPMENGMNTMNSDVINHEIPSNDFITSSLPLIQQNHLIKSCKRCIYWWFILKFNGDVVTTAFLKREVFLNYEVANLFIIHLLQPFLSSRGDLRDNTWELTFHQKGRVLLMMTVLFNEPCSLLRIIQSKRDVQPYFPLFLLCVFIYDSSTCLSWNTQTHTGCHLTDTHLTWDRFARSLTNVAPVTSVSACVTLIRALCHVLFIHDPSTPPFCTK